MIGDVRRKGLFCGAELATDRSTKEPADEMLVQAVVADCMQHRVIIGATDRSIPGMNNTLCFSPLLISSAEDIDQITDAVDKARSRFLSTDKDFMLYPKNRVCQLTPSWK